MISKLDEQLTYRDALISNYGGVNWEDGSIMRGGSGIFDEYDLRQ